MLEKKYKILECKIVDAEYVEPSNMDWNELEDASVEKQLQALAGTIVLLIQESNTQGVFQGYVTEEDIRTASGIEDNLTSKNMIDIANWLKRHPAKFGIPVPDENGDSIDIIVSRLQHDIIYVESLEEIEEENPQGEYINKDDNVNVSQKFAERMKKK